ncbi:Nn.00g000280.m01.CDS01 [Neocucurbitaria sp. VM-36]
MGKVKHLMHSLRSKFSPSRLRSKPDSNSRDSSETTSSSVSQWAENHLVSVSSFKSSAYVSSDAQTPPTTPSKTPTRAKDVDVKSRTSAPFYAALEVESFQIETDNIHEPYLGPHAILEVNMAMLDFAKKLPLDELSMIGHASSSPTPNNTIKEVSTQKEAVAIVESRTPDSYSSSRTLSLTSVSSSSTWSFACRSAHRVEQGNEEMNEDDVSSFGSLNGWGVTKCEKASYDLVNEPAPNALSALSSLTNDPSDSYESFMRYIEPSNTDGSRPTISDEEFDALPDWSDVEDDPEYNASIIKQRFAWSSTASSSSTPDGVVEGNNMVFPAVYIPSGYPAATTARVDGEVVALAPHTVGQTAMMKRGEKRKLDETQDIDIALKRAKIMKYKGKRRLPTFSSRKGRHGGFLL